jgi:hypothetical protein
MVSSGKIDAILYRKKQQLRNEATPLDSGGLFVDREIASFKSTTSMGVAHL